MSVRAVKLDVYRTAIPMRGFQHAAAKRELAEAVVVRLELADGRQGWGETHPRAYVTGETLDGVVADLRNIVWPAIAGRDLRPGESAGPVGRLPTVLNRNASGRCLNAAACAVELAAADALLDEADWAKLRQGAKEQSANYPPADAGGFTGGRPVQEAPAVRRGMLPNAATRLPVRVSGVLGSADPARTARQLLKMRLFGLRDFKLKLGFANDVDRANLSAVCRKIGKAVAAGKCTLRVDVNGAWTDEQTPQRVVELKAAGVCAVEQPAFCSAAELAALAGRCELPLIADESLLTMADAKALLAAGPRVWWNIRISKNGGLARSLALARLAAERGIPFVVGCMVGESGILSAAQRRLLEIAPRPRFLEGNYGRFLLRDDLTRPSLRFGYAGRLKTLRGTGLGMKVNLAKLARLGQLIESLGPPL
ncbi:MAG: enolase C-terminal domain-like protein [Phycisphaerae bacterium]|jgi:muconate cycloisomerase